MSKVSTRNTSHGPSWGDRVFADDRERLWAATHAGGVVVFTCISDGRHSARAIAVNSASMDQPIGDDALRAWLDAAPRIGTLP